MKSIIVDSSKDGWESKILVEQLKCQGIDSIVVPFFNSDTLYRFPCHTEPGTFLLYRDPYVRIKNPAKVLKFAIESNFGFVKQGKEYLVVSNLKTGSFDLAEEQWSIGASDSNPVSVYTVAHNRPEYLKLSLNSLIYSCSTKIPDIHILMSNPTPQVKDVCLTFHEMFRDKIKLYETKTNVALGGYNILMQLVGEKLFTIYEDDYILPASVRDYIPNWSGRFRDRLERKETGICSFECSVDNVPLHYTDYFSTRNPKIDHFVNFYSKESKQVIGTPLTTSLEIYTKNLVAPYYICPDGYLFSNFSSQLIDLKGYHIGWNMANERLGEPGNFARFETPQDSHTVYEYLENDHLKNVDIKLSDLGKHQRYTN